MNNFTIEIGEFTPPKTNRKSLKSIPTKIHNTNYSLHLQPFDNPPEIKIRKVQGSLSQRSNKAESLIKHPELSLTSRRKCNEKHQQRKTIQKLPSIFLVRNKNSDRKQKLLSKRIITQQEYKPVRQFDLYLSYINSKAQNYSLIKGKTKQSSKLYKDVMKTIEYIFFKICKSLESQPSKAKQLATVYLSFYEKLEMQASISISNNQSYLYKYLILQRLICFYIVILCGSNKFQLYTSVFVKASHNFTNFYQSLIILIEQKSNKKGMGSAIRGLKLICEIQKGYHDIFKELKSLQKPLSRQLYQAQKQLLLLNNYIDETNFHQKLAKLEFILNWKLFKLPPIPYLPPPILNYTLIFELNQTLTYYDEEKRLLMFRPFLEQFLDEIKQKYQVILFTTASKQYSDKILSQIDPFNKMFHARLYNQHISIRNGQFFKDLSKIGRDLTKTLILDSDSQITKIFTSNHIHISKWRGSVIDNQLKSIAVFLKQLFENKISDVRNLFKTQHNLLTHISQQPDQANKSIAQIHENNKQLE